MRSLLVLMVALVVTPAANATFSIAISGTKVTAPGITLNGVNQTSTFAVDATETNTGNGNTDGWNVTAASATLTSAGRTLPALEITTVAAAACTGKNCVDPTNSVTWPITLSTTPQEIYNAAPSTGEGKTVLTGTFQVTYPANALPGTYTAVVTLATSTGP